MRRQRRRFEKREMKGGKEREREREKERGRKRLEDALQAGLSRATRRFPDDYSLHSSVFREGYLLRAHKPAETA